MINNNLTKDRGGYDSLLLLATVLLIGIGLVMVFSASSAVALKRFGSDTYFFKKQLVYALAAILVLIVCRYVPYPFYKKTAYPALIAAFLLLIALYLPGASQRSPAATGRTETP